MPHLTALFAPFLVTGCFALADAALDEGEAGGAPPLQDLADGGGGEASTAAAGGAGLHDTGGPGGKPPQGSTGSGKSAGGSSGDGGSSGAGSPGGGAPSCEEPGPAPGGPCPEICTGGCEGSTCLIDCEEEECEDQTFVCPPDFDCDVACVGDQACEDGWLSCPPTQACFLWCQGEDACKGLHVSGGGSLSMHCADENACKATAVVCGSGPCDVTCAGGAKTPAVNCANSCACSPCPAL